MWGWDSLGAAEIRRLSLETPLGPQRPALPDCYSHTEYLQTTRRLSVSLFGIWTFGGYPQRSVVSAMREAGWNKKQFICPSFEPCAGQSTRLPQSKLNTQTLGLGIIRYRLSPRLATEVLVTTGSEGSVLGVDTATTPQGS